jgi:hypothetical protein
MYVYGNVSLNYTQNEKFFRNIKKNENANFMFIDVFSENNAVYEIIQKIMVETDRPQMTERGRNDDICRPDDKTRIQTHSHNI